MKAITALIAIALSCAAQPSGSRDYPVKPVPFTAVHVNDTFWAPRIETNRKVTIPFAFKKDEETGRVDNFIRAAEALRGEPFANRKPPGYPFDDTDVYKVIEGASYTLSVHPDPQLDSYLDGLIAKIAAAQEPDGYLYTARTIDPLNPHAWSGKRTLGTRRRQQPRTLRLGPSLRGGRGPLPGHRQTHATRHRAAAPPTCSIAPSAPASAPSGRDTRSWKWGSSNSTASPATCAT